MSAPLECHLFICTNTRANGEASCSDKNASALRDAVKKACNRPDWRGRVRVNAAGCLGRCAMGIAAVEYPAGQWVQNLDARAPEQLAQATAVLVEQVRASLENPADQTRS
jgi:(2Fe-2S) ferredoxin